MVHAQEAGAESNDRAAAALATLREHWDSEIITGVMVDEIKKALNAGSAEDLEPLLERLELLKKAGKVYAPDFALWWDVRGRNEIGGKLFWNRELLRDAVTTAMVGNNIAAALPMFREAAATGDPVARMWLSIAEQEGSGRSGRDGMGSIMTFVPVARDLAESGDADAAFFLGLFAREGGEFFTSSPEELIQWLEMAAEAGYDHAASLLVEVYGSGKHGVPRDRAKAMEWSRKGQSGPMDAHLRASSANNLKQLGLVGKMFANESRGEKWPGLSATPGQLAMDASAIYPEYLTDPNVYISPAHPDVYDLMDQAESDPKSVLSDHSYWYLGYAVADEDQGIEFVKQVRQATEAGTTLTDDLEAGDLDLGTIYQLREGIERFFITDINNPAASAVAQSELPIMIERPGMHESGANVLFLDGHVEFIRYPGKFPMTERFIQALESLDDLDH
jgi:prepilin-type processing-associated H-X9-DG protein